MGNIESPLGNSSFTSTQQQHYTVDDASGAQPQMPQQQPQQPQQAFGQQPQQTQQAFGQAPQQAFQPPPNAQQIPPMSAEEVMAMRQQRINEMNQAQPNDVRRVNILTGIGRASIEVPISNDDGSFATFTIQTLKAKSRRRVAKSRDILFQLKTQEALHDVKMITLAECITFVDGMPIDTLLGYDGAPDEDKFKVRKFFAEELDDNVSTFLFANFEKIDAETQKKYSLKSEDEVKEVAEAVRKSGEGTGE